MSKRKVEINEKAEMDDLIIDEKVEINEKVEMVKDEDTEQYNFICADPMHNPASLVYVGPGRSYAHCCPSCGFRITIKGPNPFYQGH